MSKCQMIHTSFAACAASDSDGRPLTRIRKGEPVMKIRTNVKAGILKPPSSNHNMTLLPSVVCLRAEGMTTKHLRLGPRSALSAATQRLAIGLTLAIMLLVPWLLVLRMKAWMYAVLDRGYPELARRLLRHEAEKRQSHSIQCRRWDKGEAVPAR
jgi:hypothetical protein